MYQPQTHFPHRIMQLQIHQSCQKNTLQQIWCYCYYFVFVKKDTSASIYIVFTTAVIDKGKLRGAREAISIAVPQSAVHECVEYCRVVG